MNKIKRRAVLRMGSWLVAASALQTFLKANGAPPEKPKIRYDLTSPEGAKMLKIYARGVAMMMDPTKFSDANPRSWLFQWYTHRVRGDREKASELTRVFAAGDPHRHDAELMWDTCQSHMDQREDFFLPWHRMYLLYFEQIVRTLTNEPTFTLPYWDYTHAAHPILPAQFRMQGDATWGSLYRPNRKPASNQGTPIDTGPNGLLTPGALASTSYIDTGSDAGFCQNLDGNPHGTLHTDVGNGLGMGSIEWAANDPIFWVHHTHIDRLWASWNKAGGKNPVDHDFIVQEFAFVDGDGKPLSAKVSDFLEMTGYEYDSYVPRPPGSPAFDRGVTPFNVRATSRKESGPIVLTNAPSTVTLTSDSSAAGAPLKPFSAQVLSLKEQEALYLRLEDVSSVSDPGIVFDVYVDGPGSAPRERNLPSFLGSLSFFSASHRHGGASNGPTSKNATRSFSFVVPSNLRAQLSNPDMVSPQVTLVPTGPVPAQSKPTIGRVALVSG
jgi:tyrosinase